MTDEDTNTVQCRFCDRDWEYGNKRIKTQREALINCELHESAQHLGRARVTITLEATWEVRPNTTKQQLSDAALESFKSDSGPFDVAYSSAEIIEACDELHDDLEKDE